MVMSSCGLRFQGGIDKLQRPRLACIHSQKRRLKIACAAVVSQVVSTLLYFQGDLLYEESLQCGSSDLEDLLKNIKRDLPHERQQRKRRSNSCTNSSRLYWTNVIGCVKRETSLNHVTSGVVMNQLRHLGEDRFMSQCHELEKQGSAAPQLQDTGKGHDICIEGAEDVGVGQLKNYPQDTALRSCSHGFGDPSSASCLSAVF